MSQQASGGGKGKAPPNPNMGSGNGVDNSNGVYNAGQTMMANSGIQPMSPSSNPAAATATPALPTTPAPATPTGPSASTPGYGKATAGNKGGSLPLPAGTTSSTVAPPATSSYAKAMGTMLGTGQIGGMQQQAANATPTPANPTPAAPTMTNTAATTTPPTGAMPASTLPNGAQPFGLGGKMQAKGRQPGQMAGPGAQNTGMGQQTSNAQQTPTGGSTVPSWASGMLEGKDQFGGTNQSRADYEQSNKLGAASNAGANLFEAMHPGQKVTQDWQGIVRQMAGQPNGDPVELMRDLQAHAGSDGQKWANVRRSLEHSGLDPQVAGHLEGMFGGSGGTAEAEARALGLSDVFNKYGGMTMKKSRNGV